MLFCRVSGIKNKPSRTTQIPYAVTYGMGDNAPIRAITAIMSEAINYGGVAECQPV